MERQELIGPAAAPSMQAAPPSAAAPKESAPRYPLSRRGGGRRRQPLFYAHCASAHQTLLHMTINKGADSSSMDMRAVRVAAAEFLGTALLVGVGCAACTNALSHDSAKLSFSSSLGFGLTVGIIIQIFGHISGAHINPAVTVCAVILEVITPRMMFIYIPSQILGGIAGFGLLRMVTPLSILKEDSHHENGFCTTVPNAELSLLDAFCSEFLATSMLILLVCASWDARNPNCQNLPTQFALGITALGMVFGQRTGGSMNPARSLGPAIWNGVWTSHWLYWLAPILAAVLTTILYRGLFGFRQAAEDEEAEGNELQQLGNGPNLAV